MMLFDETCPCGAPARKSGWCNRCESSFGAAAWEKVATPPERHRRKRVVATQTEPEAVELLGVLDEMDVFDASPAADTADDVELDEDVVPTTRGAAAADHQEDAARPGAPSTDEEALVAEHQPAVQRRHMLQMNQLTDGERGRILSLILHIQNQRGSSAITLGDMRDEIERATDTGDGRGGLHLHGQALRVLQKQARARPEQPASATAPSVLAEAEKVTQAILQRRESAVAAPNGNGTAHHVAPAAVAPAPAADAAQQTGGGEVWQVTERGKLRGCLEPDGSFRFAFSARGLDAAQYHALVAGGLAALLGCTPAAGGLRG